MRFHLFPFRTEKLSSLTPMVLRFSRGRVGSRLFKPIRKGWLFCFGYILRILALVSLILRLKEAAVPHSLCYPPPKSPSCEGDFCLLRQGKLFIPGFLVSLCTESITLYSKIKRGNKDAPYLSHSDNKTSVQVVVLPHFYHKKSESGSIYSQKLVSLSNKYPNYERSFFS